MKNTNTFTNKATTIIATALMAWAVGGLAVTAYGAAKGPAYTTDSALEYVLIGAAQAHGEIINGIN